MVGDDLTLASRNESNQFRVQVLDVPLLFQSGATWSWPHAVASKLFSSDEDEGQQLLPHPLRFPLRLRHYGGIFPELGVPFWRFPQCILGSIGFTRFTPKPEILNPEP